MPLWNHDAGRPYLDVEFVYLARRQGLRLVVRVVGPVGQREGFIQLPVRGPEPALGHRCVRVERALEGDFPEIGREDPKNEEQIGVLGLGRYPELRRQGARDLGFALQGRRDERHPVAQTGVGGGTRLGWCGRAEQVALGMEIELRPVRARDGPLVLRALHELLAGVAHLEQDPGLILPARIFSFQEMAKKFLLERDAVIGVKLRPVLDAVALQPFFF